MDDAGEKTRQREKNGSEVCELSDADREEVEGSLSFYQRNEDREKLPEALDQAGFLHCLSMSPGDGICMTAFFHEGGTQIRLHVLSIDVEAFKLASDEVCNPCSNDRIEDADPEHVAWDRDAEHFSRA